MFFYSFWNILLSHFHRRLFYPFRFFVSHLYLSLLSFFFFSFSAFKFYISKSRSSYHPFCVTGHNPLCLCLCLSVYLSLSLSQNPPYLRLSIYVLTLKSSTSQSSASQDGVPGSLPGRSLWYLWCREWFWDRFYPKYFAFPSQLPFHRSSIFIRGRKTGLVTVPGSAKGRDSPYSQHKNSAADDTTTPTAVLTLSKQSVETSSEMRQVPLLHAVDNWWARRLWPATQKMHQTYTNM